MANDAIKNIIAAAVVAGVTQAAANTNNDLKPTDIKAVAATVTPAVAKEVAPIVTNATNSEPWYQSRVIIGSGVMMLCTVAKLAGHEISVVDQGSLTDWVLLGGQLVGSGLALYGRLFGSSLKPLGS